MESLSGSSLSGSVALEIDGVLDILGVPNVDGVLTLRKEPSLPNLEFSQYVFISPLPYK